MKMKMKVKKRSKETRRKKTKQMRIQKKHHQHQLIEIDCRCGDGTHVEKLDEAMNDMTLPILIRGAGDAWCTQTNAWSMQELMMAFANFTGRVRLKYDKDDASVEAKDRKTEFTYSEDTQSTSEAMPMWEFLIRLMLTTPPLQGWIPRWLKKAFSRDASIVKVYMQAIMNGEMERRIGIEETRSISFNRETDEDEYNTMSSSSSSWMWRLISRKGMETTQARKIWISAGSVTVRYVRVWYHVAGVTAVLLVQYNITHCLCIM